MAEPIAGYRTIERSLCHATQSRRKSCRTQRAGRSVLALGSSTFSIIVIAQMSIVASFTDAHVAVAQRQPYGSEAMDAGAPNGMSLACGHK